MQFYVHCHLFVSPIIEADFSVFISTINKSHFNQVHNSVQVKFKQTQAFAILVQ